MAWPEGVAVVEDLAQARTPCRSADTTSALTWIGALDQLPDVRAVEAPGALDVGLDQAQDLRVGDEAALDDLGQAGDEVVPAAASPAWPGRTSTPAGGWNAPTRFLPSAVLMPVLPPTAASTMPSSVVGIWTTRTPRSQVAATNPARSVVAPPPSPTTASVRVKPDLPSTSQHVGQDRGRDLASSASGTSMASAPGRPRARRGRRGSPRRWRPARAGARSPRARARGPSTRGQLGRAGRGRRRRRRGAVAADRGSRVSASVTERPRRLWTISATISSGSRSAATVSVGDLLVERDGARRAASSGCRARCPAAAAGRG